MSGFESALRLERAFPAPRFPSNPGRDKCNNYLRFQVCKRGAQCHFDHPQLYRPEARIEKDIHDTLPELALLVELSGKIKAACDRAAKDKTPALPGVTLQDLLAAALVEFFDLVDCVLPLSEDALRGSSPRHVAHAHQLYFYFECLPRMVKAIRAIPGNATGGGGHFLRGLWDAVDAKMAACMSRLSAREQADAAVLEGCLSPGSDAWLANLDRDVLEHARQQAALMGPKKAALEAVRLALLSALQGPFAQAGYSVELRAFGSIVTGLGSPKSDLDLSLALVPLASSGAVAAGGSEALGGKAASAPLDALLLALGVARPLEDDDDLDLAALMADGAADDDEEDDEDDGEGGGAGAGRAGAGAGQKKDRSASLSSNPPSTPAFTVREFISSARVPVLKLHHPATATDIDVINNNTNGLTNTQLLRQYAGMDPRTRPLLLAVKRWTSSRGVGNSSNSTLSSYAWVLLVVFFLQTRGVLPNLQEGGSYLYRPDAKGSVYGEGEGEGEGAEGREAAEAEAAAAAAAGGGAEGVGRLLCDFFLFYGVHAPQCFQCHLHVAAVRFALALPKPHHRDQRAGKGGEGPKAQGAARGAAKDVDGPGRKEDEGGDKDAAVEGLREALGALGVDDASSASPVAADATAEGGGAEGSAQGRACALSLSSAVARNAQWGRFSVEDPIELPHDLGSVIHNPVGQAHIQAELRRACDLVAAHAKAARAGAGAGPGLGAASLLEALCEAHPCVPSVPFNTTCRLCREEGHSFKLCPLFTCHRCGERGHLARDCTKPALRRKEQRGRRGDRAGRGGGQGGGPGRGQGGRGGDGGGGGGGGGDRRNGGGGGGRGRGGGGGGGEGGGRWRGAGGRGRK